jgi:hypothetical protein
MTAQVYIDAKQICFVIFPAFSGLAKIRKVATTVFPALKKDFLTAKKAFLTPKTVRKVANKAFSGSESISFTPQKVSDIAWKTV